MEPHNEDWLCCMFDHSTKLEDSLRKFKREVDWDEYQDVRWKDQPEYQDVSWRSETPKEEG
jgi:hypothetical protein